MSRFLLLSRILLGAVFTVSGWEKLTAPYQNFLAVIEGFRVLSGAPALVLARTLPWVEFVLGIFLLVGLWSRFSLGALWTMNTVFIGVLASAILRKLPIKECGCFGEALSLPLPAMLAVDGVLWGAFFFLWLVLGKTKLLSLDGLLEK
jgi:uncharacterized membrane protein YphA (DoxX/SURF4 family)